MGFAPSLSEDNCYWFQTTLTSSPQTLLTSLLPHPHSGWKHYVFPHCSIRCLSILVEVSMSLQTHRGQLRRKVHQREIPSVSSSILPVWTWANSSFTTPATPFHFKLADHFSLAHAHKHTHTHAHRFPASSPWIERDKRFSSGALRGTSWLFVALAEEPEERPGNTDRGKDHLPKNSRPRYFAKQHVWMGQTLGDGTMVVYLMFAYGNHFPKEIKTRPISKKKV